MVSTRNFIKESAKNLIAGLTGFFLFASTAVGESDYNTDEDNWFQSGQEALELRLSVEQNTHTAKNVILFIADGLGVTTAVAARIYDGQEKGEDGEENFLSWERFPYSALVKVYSQMPKSPILRQPHRQLPPESKPTME